MGVDQRNQRKVSIIDSIPEALWCEARVLYIKKQMTVREIANVFHCDVRTVSRMIRENQERDEIGKQRTPNKIDAYKEAIGLLLTGEQFKGMHQISAVADALFEELQPQGYYFPWFASGR